MLIIFVFRTRSQHCVGVFFCYGQHNEEYILKSQQRTSQGIQSVPTIRPSRNRLYFCAKISTFGGNPPSLTVFVWALSFAYRIRKQIHHREDIRIRTHSIKPKPSPLRCERRKYPQGGILYPLQSPPPRTKSRFYHAWV